MNEEARALLSRELARYRRRTFADLKNLIGDVTVIEVTGQSGGVYQIEIEVFFEDKRTKANLLVLGSIDDGRLPGALFPLSESFILAPDGRFVGE